MGDTMREGFEKWIARRDEPFTNWALWQAAHEQGRQLGMEQERALWLMANDAAERKLYERITPTQQAGGSDKEPT